jgi:prepilin-type N-terminal cleavage/methylation domain-containing protein
MNHKGFTLIELLIVMTIIGLLAVIAIPQLSYTKQRAQVAAMKADLRNLVTAEENYFADSQKYTTNLGSSFAVSGGSDMPTITVTGDGWTASITSPSSTQVCAVFVGSTSLAPATKEGAPACEKREAATISP